MRNVSFSNSPLAAEHWNESSLSIPGLAKTAGQELSTCVASVDQSFLTTMQIPILLGRDIEQRDLESPRVAVVNEKFVKKFFPGENPIGRHFGIGDSTARRISKSLALPRQPVQLHQREGHAAGRLRALHARSRRSSGVVFELRGTAIRWFVSPSARSCIRPAPLFPFPM